MKDYSYFTLDELKELLELEGSNKSIGKHLADMGFKKKIIKKITHYYHFNYDKSKLQKGHC